MLSPIAIFLLLSSYWDRLDYCKFFMKAQISENELAEPIFCSGKNKIQDKWMQRLFFIAHRNDEGIIEVTVQCSINEHIT